MTSKMKPIALAVVFMMALLAGCATTKLTSEQAAKADYGEFPTEYDKVIKEHFSRSLFDPYSAHYRIGFPTQGFSTKAPIVGGGPDQYGYLVNVAINAKNKFGGYVGEKQFRVLIRDGRVIREWQLTY